MHGRGNTGTSLLGVLSELKDPTLAASSAILDAYLNTHAPANASNACDLRSSLSLMIDATHQDALAFEIAQEQHAQIHA